MRPVHHNIRDDLGREPREFGDERGDEARQMRLFVFFDTSRDAPHMSIFFNRGNAHELGAPTSSHGGFRRLDAPFLSPQTGACAVAAFAPRRNASTFSVAYAARHDSVSFGVVTLPRSS